MLRRAFILILLAGVATTVIAKSRGTPRPKDGDYNFTVAGYVHGSGVGTVGAERLKLTADVTAGDGAKGELNAANLVLRNNHFSGTGNVLGEQVTFEGRIDVPSDETERAIRGVRLVCLVKTNDGRYAKLIGYIPSQAQARDKIDDDDDRERGKNKKK
jgi:hypothetical protein